MCVFACVKTDSWQCQSMNLNLAGQLSIKQLSKLRISVCCSTELINVVDPLPGVQKLTWHFRLFREMCLKLFHRFKHIVSENLVDIWYCDIWMVRYNKDRTQRFLAT